MASAKFDGLAFKGKFKEEWLPLFREMNEEEKAASFKFYGKLNFSLTIVKTPENLNYENTPELHGFRFFWRAYPTSANFQPDMFTWKKIGEDLFGGILKDDSYRTRDTLPPSGPKMVPR